MKRIDRKTEEYAVTLFREGCSVTEVERRTGIRDAAALQRLKLVSVRGPV